MINYNNPTSINTIYGRKIWKIETYLLIFIIGLLNLYSILKDIELKIGDSSIILKEKKIGIIIFLTILFIIIFSLTTSLKIYNKEDKLFDRRNKIEIKIILLLSLIGIILFIISEDLFILYLSIELYSLSSYLLVLSIINPTISKYSIIYFLIGNISSSMILIGLALIYYSFGTLNYTFIKTFTFMNTFNYESLPLYDLGFIFILIGLLFKIGAFPFQFWIIRIYPSLDTFILTFIIILPKIAYLYIILEILSINVNIYIKLLILFTSLGSIILGSILGFNYSKFKFILTFSSLLNLGFFLLLFSLYSYFYYSFSLTFWSILLENSILIFNGKIDNQFFLLINYLEDCNLTFFYYILLYSFNTLNIFFIYLFSKNKYNYYLKDLFSIIWNNKLLSFFLFLSFFSLIGIPPLVGFYPKFLLILNLYYTNHPLFLLSIFIILLSTLFSTLFYLIFIINSSNTSSSESLVDSQNFNIKTSFIDQYWYLSFFISFFSYFILFFFIFLPYLSPFLLLFSS